MPAISDVINISVVVQAAQVTRQGFGTPMILAPLAELPAGFNTRTTRTYSSQTSLATDFAAGTSVNALAAAIFAQQPHPPQIKVGAMSVNPTQKFVLTPQTVVSYKFTGTIDGQAWSYTSSPTDTLAQICTGIAAAITALTLTKPVTVTTPSNTSVQVVANNPGDYHTMSVTSGTPNLAIAQTHADPGLAADLTAIYLADPAWYFPLFGFPSSACVQAISGWAESQQVEYLAQTQDSAIVDTTAVGDTSSVAYLLRAKTRTALIYKVDMAENADAAWAGFCGPLAPGSETWAYKTLAGVNPDVINETQRTNALAKHVNLYDTIGGLNVTEQGQVLSGQYIDVQRFIDWLVSNMGADIFQALANSTKIPYTDSGISVIKGVILARLDLGVAAGGLAANPAPVVVVPQAASVSSGDRAARVLNGVSFTARLAGAIHTTNISGTISA